jgi:hypothetical protein
MKLSQYGTPESTEPNLSTMGTWAMSLYQLHKHLAPRFARPEVHQHALLYLQAILSDIPRKNGWQIAEYARQSRPCGMQRLLSRAVWDQDAVREEVLANTIWSLARACISGTAFSRRQARWATRGAFCSQPDVRNMGSTQYYLIFSIASMVYHSLTEGENQPANQVNSRIWQASSKRLHPAWL